MADEVNENIFLVNAPAGSGKTTWIRQQVESYLLRNPKDNILCITYTNRAAEELGRDLEQSRVYFGTIHSFINDFIGSFFSHKEIIDLYWKVYETQIIERIKNTEQKETWTEGAERYKEKYGSFWKKYSAVDVMTKDEARINDALLTPQLWTYNNGYLLNPPESFISSSSVEQKKQIAEKEKNERRPIPAAASAERNPD